MPRTPFASGNVQNMWDQNFWSCISGSVASFKLSDAKIFMYTHTNQISKSGNTSFMHAHTHTMVPRYTTLPGELQKKGKNNAKVSFGCIQSIIKWTIRMHH